VVFLLFIYDVSSDVFWGRLRDHKHILKNNKNNKPLILIIAPPGDLQIGLQALLTTHLEADVLVTGEESSAMKVIARHNPTLIIVDNDLPRNAAAMIIQHIKSSWPDMRSIVFVNDDQGRQKFLCTEADLIVVKGIPGSKLVTEIEEFLRPDENI
jgi:DNA-binding NarL/FixJ family response regulator